MAKSQKLISVFSSLKGCGPAFFTKFFYFIGLAYNLKPLPVILDANVAKCLELICRQEGWRLEDFVVLVKGKKGNVSLKRYAEGYQNYVLSMDRWAEELGCRADEIEYFMYQNRGKNLQGKGGKMGEKALTLHLSSGVMKQLEKIARAMDEKAGDVAARWIEERSKQAVAGRISKWGDYKDAPRWLIGIAKGQANNLDGLKGAHHKVSVRLVIGGNEYEAVLHFVKEGVHIKPQLNGGKLRLVDVLKKAGFREGLVELKVQGERIIVVRQV